MLAAGLALVIVAVLSLVQPADQAVKEITLPLRHEDIIRQQAADKGLDPALIAGVIYTESRFRDQTSHAGAKGLMQMMPETADYIARKSGGTRFERARPRDAADQHRLRLLVPALPAATSTTATRSSRSPPTTRARARSTSGARDGRRRGARSFQVASHIPFKETRDYVHRVLDRARRLPHELQARTRPLNPPE